MSTKRTRSIKLPRKYDRRIKLTDKEREEIRQRYDKGHTSYKELAEEYHVSARLIDLVVNPEKYEILKEQYRERRKDGSYKLPKESAIAAQKNLREYKKRLVENGKISI